MTRRAWNSRQGNRAKQIFDTVGQALAFLAFLLLMALWAALFWLIRSTMRNPPAAVFLVAIVVVAWWRWG